MGESDSFTIKVVGVGHAGCNIIQGMIDRCVPDMEFIAVDTDADSLSYSSARNIIQLGAGRGSGMNAGIGRCLAEEARSRIEAALSGADVVFILAGMGKGTGSGASPVIAEIAKSLGALTVAAVSMPCSFEGEMADKNADEGIARLFPRVDSISVYKKSATETFLQHASMTEWLDYDDKMLSSTVTSIAEIARNSCVLNP